MTSSSRPLSEHARDRFRPSPAVRWPLYATNAVLLLLVLALLAVGYLRDEIADAPSTLTLGAALLVCFFFLAVNSAVAGVAVALDSRGLVLCVWPFRRSISWEGCAVEKIVRPPVGVTALRLVAADGRSLWLSAGWFRDFEGLHAAVESRARDAGGRVSIALR